MNKVNTKATLRWDIAKSPSLTDSVRKRFVEQNRRRMTGDGEVIMTSQRYRDQGRNVADCLAKLRDLLEVAMVVPKKRRPTKPSRGAKRRRLENKRINAQKKQQRRPPKLDGQAANLHCSRWREDKTMFGKPEWFVAKKFGWGLTPITKEGWIYTGVWAAVLSLPFLILLFLTDGSMAERVIKACVWMGAMMGLLIFDVKLILKAMARKEEEKDVFRIMDEEETRQETTETGKFAMHVTDSGRAKQA